MNADLHEDVLVAELHLQQADLLLQARDSLRFLPITTIDTGTSYIYIS